VEIMVEGSFPAPPVVVVRETIGVAGLMLT
jgi:hypothetical protein